MPLVVTTFEKVCVIIYYHERVQIASNFQHFLLLFFVLFSYAGFYVKARYSVGNNALTVLILFAVCY